MRKGFIPSHGVPTRLVHNLKIIRINVKEGETLFMSSYDDKVNKAIEYIDAVYRIEVMRSDGVFGLYGLEQNRICKHDELCDIMQILDKSKTKDICLNLDKSIGFDVVDLEKDYDYFVEKYAKRLVAELGKLPL